jgi:DNA-directed RNA polymerase specialized sigma24 family protein
MGRETEIGMQSDETKIVVGDFEKFYLDHIGLVQYLVLSLRGPYEQDREDLVQEVFLKICLAIQRGTLRSLHNTPSWVGTITSCTICSFFRRQEVRKRHYEEWNEEVSLSWEAPSGALNLVFDGEIDAVVTAFKQLSAKDQDVLRRFLVEGTVKQGHEHEVAGDRTAPTHDRVRWAQKRIRRYYQREA